MPIGNVEQLSQQTWFALVLSQLAELLLLTLAWVDGLPCSPLWQHSTIVCIGALVQQNMESWSWTLCAGKVSTQRRYKSDNDLPMVLNNTVVRTNAPMKKKPLTMVPAIAY